MKNGRVVNKNKTTESDPVDLKQVVEEIIDYVNG
jgi:hypothetical protein